MTFSIRKVIAAVGVAGLASVAVPLATSQSAGAVGPNIYAIDNSNQIVTLTSNLHNNPATIVESHDITGLVDEDTVVGLDRSPHDGQLYVVGRSEDLTVVYTIDPTTGEAYPLAALVNLENDDAPIVLEGNLFAVDIFPNMNAISIISDTGQSIVAALGFIEEGSGFLNPGDGIIAPDTGVTGLTGSAFAPNDPDCDCNPTLYTTSRTRLYTTDYLTGTTTFVANLQSASHNGFDSGLDVVTSGETSTAYYSRTVSPPAGVNSSVYTINLTNGTTTRLLTTPTGVSLREIAL